MNKYKRDYKRKYNHSNNIQKPYYENKNCSSFLGVIAENILSGVFKDVKKMPYGNPKFDFICNKGFLVDVKTSTLREIKEKGINKYWFFTIRRNKTPDYFLFLGIDSRDNFTPLKVWLVPSKYVNNNYGITITNSKEVLKKWEKYEMKDKLQDIKNLCKNKVYWTENDGDIGTFI